MSGLFRALRPDLPSDLDVPLVPLRHLLVANDGGAWGDDPTSEDDPIVLRSTEQAADGTWKIENPARRKLTPREFNKTRLLAGDILITKSSGSADHIGKASLVTPEIEELGASYSNFMQRLRVADHVHPRFATYLLNHQFVRRQMAFLSNSTTGLANISASIIGLVRVPLPSLQEQEEILAVLDQETGLIDGLIEKKTRFIELLKEKRAALITHAVTKGVDAGVPMKDGGFKALGSIPEHWNLNPLGRALRLNKRTVGKRHADFTLLSLTTRGIIVRDISENAGKFPESFETYQEVSPGDFVFCLFDMDETPRTVGRSEVAGMITGAYSVFECIDPVYSSFLLYLFLHLDSCKGLKPFYTGLRKTIRPPRFASIRVPFPPVEEAARIVSYIEDQTARIDGLISKTDRSIELLKEKRSALITAAVTGKIDIREAA